MFRASYRKCRPTRAAAGDGSKRSGTTAVSAAVAGLFAFATIEIDPSKRFMTKSWLWPSSSATPEGPSPTSTKCFVEALIVPASSDAASKMPTFCEPSPAT